MLAFLLALGLTTADASTKVTLKATDGQRITAYTERVKASTRGVVLVHMAGRSAADWDYLSDKLAQKDFQVIAPDLRGHGASTVGGRELTNDDYLAMVKDVAASIAWLRSQGVQQVSCAGATLGANLCLRAAAEDPGVVNLVLLSPGLNYKGVTSGDALKAYGDRPVLFIASEEDQYAAKSSQMLSEAATGQKHFELLEQAGNGNKMLNRDPGLEGVIFSWLLGTYQLASGEVVLPKPSVTTEIGTVETEGKKLGSHQ